MRSYLKKASTMKAMNSAVKSGLENLKTVHEAFSLGLISNQMENAIMTAPKTLAVTK